MQVSSGPPLVSCKQLEKDKSFSGVREASCGNRTSKRLAGCILSTLPQKPRPSCTHGGILGVPDVGHIERLAASTTAAHCEASQGEQELQIVTSTAYLRPPQRCLCLADHSFIYAHNMKGAAAYRGHTLSQ